MSARCRVANTVSTSNGMSVSLPPDHEVGSLLAPQDSIPADDERKLRRLLQETLPWLANRPFVDQKLCWFADTADSDCLIDYVPQTSNSPIVVSGDSGHGFKMMPVFGKWVLNCWRANDKKKRAGSGDMTQRRRTEEMK